jgi:hypothetical protein
MARKRLLDPRPIYYIYVLCDWLGSPFYVGKGTGNRVDTHEKNTDPRNQLKNEIIEQTWAMLDEIPKVIVREQLPEVTAYEIEIALIGAIGRLDLGTGPLTNLTAGGEGCRLSFDHRSAVMTRTWEGRDLEERKAIGKKVCDTLGPEGRKARGRKIIDNQTPEQLSARAIKTCETLGPEGLSARALKAWANMTDEARARRCHTMRLGAIRGQETLGPEGRRARAKKANETMGPAGLSARSAAINESLGPEGRRARALKAWETKRAKKAAAELAALAATPPPEFTPSPISGITPGTLSP